MQVISTHKPRWLRDLVRFLPLRSQFVLSGNVRDLHIHEPAPGEVTAVPLATILVDQLKGSGYQRIVTFDPVGGFRSIATPGASAEAGDEFVRGLGLLPSNGAAQGGIDLLVNVLERFVGLDGTPAVLIVDFASRLIVRHEALSQTEHQLFSRALVLSHSARTRPGGPERQPFFNTVIWIVDKEGDLPDWFLIGNPRIRHIPIAKPDHLARRSLTSFLMRTTPARGLPVRHPLMHRTRTVDYAVVLSGEIDMMLDDSVVHVKAGDVIVQQATNHAWINRGTQPCRILFALIDSRQP